MHTLRLSEECRYVEPDRFRIMASYYGDGLPLLSL